MVKAEATTDKAGIHQSPDIKMLGCSAKNRRLQQARPV